MSRFFSAKLHHPLLFGITVTQKFNLENLWIFLCTICGKVSTSQEREPSVRKWVGSGKHCKCNQSLMTTCYVSASVLHRLQSLWTLARALGCRWHSYSHFMNEELEVPKDHTNGGVRPSLEPNPLLSDFKAQVKSFPYSLSGLLLLQVSSIPLSILFKTSTRKGIYHWHLSLCVNLNQHATVPRRLSHFKNLCPY